MPKTPPKPKSEPQLTLCRACGSFDYPVKDRLARPDGVTALSVDICPRCGTLRAVEPKGR